MARRKLELITLGWVLPVLALVVLTAVVSAGPVAAAAAVPPTDDQRVVPATGNATAMAIRRNGDFVYIVSKSTDISTVASTLWEVTPKPIGPSGISVKSLMPGFAWAPVLGATEYRLDLYSDVRLSQLVTSITTAVPAAVFTQPLAAGVDYYWTVRVTRPAASLRSWASFHVSPQATAPVVPVTTAAASRPRAAYSGGTNMIPQPAMLRIVPKSFEVPEPIVIDIPAHSTPARVILTPAAPATPAVPTAVLPVIFVIGGLLLCGVLTLILSPCIAE
jgi:hypothetical protein